MMLVSMPLIFVWLQSISAAAAILPPCSLNGVERDGKCVCDVQWSGDDCERLRLLPAKPNAGFQPNGKLDIYSSWGSSVVQVDGTYHMFAAVMQNGCGLDAWRPNSAIGHATSALADGPYELVEIIKHHFAHSPHVVYDASDGLYLIYHVGAGKDNMLPCTNTSSSKCEWATNCSNGCTGAAHPILSGLDFYGPLAVLRSKSVEGPWDDVDIAPCDKVPECEPNPSTKWPGAGNDMNPAPLIDTSGSVSLLWRAINYSSSGQSYYALASAPKWNGVYTFNTSNIFPEYNSCHIEDGFAYKNKHGFHAMFHSDCEGTSGGAAGGHAYSIDGTNWILHPKNAYNNTITLNNGTVWTLSRRERPKLIINAEGEITHISNGISLSHNKCPNGDHSFTFVQPIATTPQ
eukprot:m.86708 g.86708  ORF g.86708 m.86708 type:complete len:403 (-) comp25991_c0_seq2:154-1362(-)